MSIKNDLLKHQIFLQRLGATHATSIQKILNKGITFVSNFIEKYPEGLSKAQIRYLHKKLAETFHRIAPVQLGLLSTLALYESEFIINRLLKNKILRNVKTPSNESIINSVKNSTVALYTGGSKQKLETSFLRFGNVKASEIIMKVNDVSVSSKANKIESINNELENLALGLFAVQSLTLGKTTVTQTSSVSRQEVYKENALPLVDWVTELDGDVCPDCEALANAGPYEIGTSEIPPEHWNCRCVLVPISNE